MGRGGRRKRTRVRVLGVTRGTQRCRSRSWDGMGTGAGRTDAPDPSAAPWPVLRAPQRCRCSLGGKCPVGQVPSRSGGSPMGVGSLLPGKSSSRSPTLCSPRGRRGWRPARRGRPLPTTGGGVTLPPLGRPGPRCAEERDQRPSSLGTKPPKLNTKANWWERSKVRVYP